MDENLAPTSNVSVTSFDRDYIHWSFIVLEVAALVVIVVGDVSVLIMFFSRKLLGQSSNILVFSIAIGDLLIGLLVLPLAMLQKVSTESSDFLCKSYFYFINVSKTAVGYTILMLAMERVVAVLIHALRMLPPGRCLFFASLTWFFAAAYNIWSVVIYDLEVITLTSDLQPKKLFLCFASSRFMYLHDVFEVLNPLVTFVAPAGGSSLLFVYFLRNKDEAVKPGRPYKSSQSVIIFTFALLVSYVVSHLPWEVASLVMNHSAAEHYTTQLVNLRVLHLLSLTRGFWDIFIFGAFRHYVCRKEKTLAQFREQRSFQPERSCLTVPYHDRPLSTSVLDTDPSISRRASSDISRRLSEDFSRRLSSEVRRPSGEVRRQSSEVRRPSGDFCIRSSGDVNRRPSSDFNRRLSSDFNRRPSSDFNRRPSSDFNRRPSSDFNRRPSSDFNRRPSSDFNRRPPESSHHKATNDNSYIQNEHLKIPDNSFVSSDHTSQDTDIVRVSLFPFVHDTCHKVTSVHSGSQNIDHNIDPRPQGPDKSGSSDNEPCDNVIARGDVLEDNWTSADRPFQKPRGINSSPLSLELPAGRTDISDHMTEHRCGSDIQVPGTHGPHPREEQNLGKAHVDGDTELGSTNSYQIKSISRENRQNIDRAAVSCPQEIGHVHDDACVNSSNVQCTQPCRIHPSIYLIVPSLLGDFNQGQFDGSDI